VKARFVSIAFALVVAACTGDAAVTSAPATAAQTTAASLELNILGAASLKGALDAAKSAYEASHAGVTLTISTDSSAALETKIEQGAPADVFLSADTTNPKKLVDGGFASGTAINFAGNKLAVIVPKDNPAGIRTPADLARAGVKIIAAGDEVPITKYATQLVRNLADQPDYPAAFDAAYASNVVSKEENVKAVVAKIALGQGDAAICYVTDAVTSADIETIDIPLAANVPATYAGVVVKASANADAARAFLDWIASADGQGVLATFGFLPPAG
jgi:molybdate transport system substrate-binding protein